jgi:hypothetical protein
MISDGLELGGINSEELFQTLDLLHQVLWHIGHGACNIMLAKIRRLVESKVKPQETQGDKPLAGVAREHRPLARDSGEFAGCFFWVA